jgi:CHAT domain-containing protein
LGAVEIGEGSLGLQQSFQIAGARATISSQWKVDDSATQTLMVEFYRNLWEEKLPQGEALRQAQLSMLNRYDPAKQSLQSRGLKLVNPGQAEKANDRLQPFYWASFFLSGDWQ